MRRLVLLALCVCLQACALDDGDDGSSSSDDVSVPAVKGIFVWGQTIRGHEPAFASWATARGYSDVYVLVKGTSGAVAYDVLAALLHARDASPHHFRVWAWVAGFADHSHAVRAWHYAVGDWVAPDDLGYRAHLVSVIRDAIDPARGRVPEPPDGVMLDDSFQWPSASFGTSTTHRVQTLMATVDAIHAEIASIAAAHHHTIRLGFAPHPEVGVVAKTATEITTVAAHSYGQDFGELGKRCDWILPETYRYDFYAEPAAWVGTVVSDIRHELTLEAGARAHLVVVDPVLVLYHGDTDVSPISGADLAADRSAARVASGYSVFRYMSPSSDGQQLPTAHQDQVLDHP